MKCGKCGRDNDDNYTLCPGCGEPRPGLFGEQHDFYSISGSSDLKDKFTSIDITKQLSQSNSLDALSKTDSALDALRKSSDEQLKSSEAADRRPPEYKDYAIDDMPTARHESDTARAAVPTELREKYTYKPPEPTVQEKPEANASPRTEAVLPPQLTEMQPVEQPKPTSQIDSLPRTEANLPPQLMEMDSNAPRREDIKYDYYTPPPPPPPPPPTAFEATVAEKVGFLLLGMFFPIAGFVIFAIRRTDNPEAAKFALFGGIIGTVLGVCCCGSFGSS